MRDVNRQQTSPITVRRSRRNSEVKVLTSFNPGVCAPVYATEILREDSAVGAINVAIEMRETVEILLNPIHVTLSAYVVPWLAMERFEGSVDQFNRSYAGLKKTEDASAVVVPFFETHSMGTHGSNLVYKTLGLHAQPTAQVNTMFLEAYNHIWNFRAKNRSKEITPRTRLEATLAKAFWPRSRFEHIVPDFDQAKIDGEVALAVVSEKLPVKGLGQYGTTAHTAYYGTTNISHVRTSDSTAVPTGEYSMLGGQVVLKESVTNPGYPDVFVELQAEGVKLSLANIELAKKTVAFAKLRERFNGFDDDYIIDMLMNGLTIPEQNLKQPILVAQSHTVIRQNKRYATDSANLDEHVTSGLATAGLRIRVPQLHTGGILMVIAEAVPEQLFERQADPFFTTATVASLPEYLRDELDPEKVDVIKNGEIDTAHATPGEAFGYAPLNWKWNNYGPRIGGNRYRPTTNTTVDEERQRIYAVEEVNPKLTENFYVVAAMHKKPFYDTSVDPFDIVLAGNIVKTGNTVFGGVLHEATDDYDEVLAEAPQDRIVKPA